MVNTRDNIANIVELIQSIFTYIKHVNTLIREL